MVFNVQFVIKLLNLQIFRLDLYVSYNIQINVCMLEVRLVELAMILLTLYYLYWELTCRIDRISINKSIICELINILHPFESLF